MYINVFSANINAAVQHVLADVGLMQIGPNGVTIKISGARFVGEKTDCINTEKYSKWSLLKEHGNYESIFSSLLMAKAANIKVSFVGSLGMCHNGYAKIATITVH